EDLPSLDPQLYKNLLFLKHYEGDAEDLGLTFTIDQSVFGDVTSKEIKPGGSRVIPVNQECREQFRAFVMGFQSVIPGKCLSFFAPHELQKMMSGENVDFDVKDLRAFTRYEGGYFDHHATIRAFWQVLNELSPKEKSAFLKFVTSCSKPPVGGFKFLEPPFTIRHVLASDDESHNSNAIVQVGKQLGSLFGLGKDASRLPTAATCFNLLKLPAYQKKSVLKAKLLYAIQSGTGFELS
ncbi:Ubiquitin-protein ligase E3B, partial [Chytridiales sp. JEL 0842]